MGEIIERYKVIYDFEGYPDRAAWCHYRGEAYRIAELASDDMRKVLRLLNRRAEIIKAQRASCLYLQDAANSAEVEAANLHTQLDEQRATIAELREQLKIAQLDNRMLEVRLEAAHDNVAELEKTSAEQFDLCETLRDRIYALRTKNNEFEAEVARLRAELRGVEIDRDCWHASRNIWIATLEAELAERDAQLSNKARWAAAWKKAAKTYWWCNSRDVAELEAELATCQSDLRRAQLEVAELQAERAGCLEMCMGDDVLAVIPGLWGESAPDPHYGGD